MCSSNQGPCTLNPNPMSETLHSTPQAYSPRWEGSTTVSSALEVDKGTEIAHLGSALWSGERLRVWASSQNLKRAATIYRFSAVKIFEEREFMAARFRFWQSAHTRWCSPDHKTLLKCVILFPQTTSRAGLIVVYTIIWQNSVV